MPASTPILTPFSNPLIRFISDPKYRWIRHVLFILVGLILAFKGDIGVSTMERSPGIQRAILLIDMMTFFFIMTILYVVILVLVPRLLFRSRVFLFAVSILLTVAVIFAVVYLLDYFILRPVDPDHTKLQHIDMTFVSFIQISAVSAVVLVSVIGLMVFKKWIQDIKLMQEIQQVNLKTELAQLKSQVNPHFLFNTLNNLYVLTKTDPEKASQVLLGLSDLLRYQLYDSAREKIQLTKDIDFIHNLLSLEKIRKNDFEYGIHTNGNLEGISLPPFLFIPFVENAIKHGASSVGHSYLNLDFIVAEQHLHFRSVNSKPAVSKKITGGLGLANIQRRLELLYPGNHTLEIIDDPEKYSVHLILPI
jgi:sensor histidine kinase YesM